LKADSDYNFVKEEAGLTGNEELFEKSGNNLLINFKAADAGTIRYAATFRSSTNNVNISTTEKAIDALKYIDEAQVTVNTMRAKMGATMTRIQYTINNLMNLVENTEAAKSRVLDTDYAAESANLAKSQILAQAGTAMLAQANQSQQYVLNLLKG
jgi:flagellin